MHRPYYLLDVFTDQPLAGNQLAVVIDSDGLDAATMQKIAAEFNLSETVFIFPPRDPINTARLRIFTPKAELPFAGHPTIGAAVLIGELRAASLMRSEDVRIVLEEPVGDVICHARHRPGSARQADFFLPKLPVLIGEAQPKAKIAAALGLTPEDIGFDRHQPAIFSAVRLSHACRSHPAPRSQRHDPGLIYSPRPSRRAKSRMPICMRCPTTMRHTISKRECLHRRLASLKIPRRVRPQQLLPVR